MTDRERLVVWTKQKSVYSLVCVNKVAKNAFLFKCQRITTGSHEPVVI